MGIWNQERTVAVTYHPRTARKQPYTLQRKPDSLHAVLVKFRRYYRGNRPHWRSPETIRERYHRACETIHIGSQYYVLEFAGQRKAADMSFRKDRYQVGKSEALSGKNLMVSGNQDWATEEIVQLSLDRYGVG